MNSAPLVHVITVNYNGLKYLQACLSSLEQQTYPNCRIVVFDNASTDASVKFIKQNFPKVSLIQYAHNEGFARGNNLAIQVALDQGADYVFLVNNDTEADRGLIERLVRCAEGDNLMGVLAPSVFDISNRLRLQEMGMAVDRFGYPLAIQECKENIPGFYVSGCAMLIKSEVLRKIGCFDDNYFMFAEDLDFCWRARLAGYKVCVDKSSRIYHASGGSLLGGVIKASQYKTSTRRVFLRERNTIRTLIKDYGTSNMLKVVPLYVLLLLVESFFWSCALKPHTSEKILKAIFWNLRFLSDTFKQRVRVQSLRKISDREITKQMISGYNKLRVFGVIGLPSFGSS